MTPLAGSAAGKIMAGEAIPDDDMLKITGRALKISNDDSISWLGKPGLGGKPFIDRILIDNLAARIGKIRHKRVIHEADEEYDRVNGDLVSFFRSRWNL